MQKARAARIVSFVGLAVIIAELVFLMYSTFEAAAQRNSLTGMNNFYHFFISSLDYFYVLMFVGFALIIGGGIYVNRSMKGAVGKVFRIERLQGTNSGYSHYDGIRFRITSSDELAEGDFVKITGTSSTYAGRARIILYLGKKLSQDDPDYPKEEQFSTTVI